MLGSLARHVPRARHRLAPPLRAPPGPRAASGRAPGRPLPDGASRNPAGPRDPQPEPSPWRPRSGARPPPPRPGTGVTLPRLPRSPGSLLPANPHSPVPPFPRLAGNAARQVPASSRQRPLVPQRRGPLGGEGRAGPVGFRPPGSAPGPHPPSLRPHPTCPPSDLRFLVGPGADGGPSGLGERPAACAAWMWGPASPSLNFRFPRWLRALRGPTKPPTPALRPCPAPLAAENPDVSTFGEARAVHPLDLARRFSRPVCNMEITGHFGCRGLRQLQGVRPLLAWTKESGCQGHRNALTGPSQTLGLRRPRHQ